MEWRRRKYAGEWRQKRGKKYYIVKIASMNNLSSVLKRIKFKHKTLK